MQRELVYPAPHAVFSTYWLNDNGVSREDLGTLMADVRSDIHNNSNLRQCNTTAIVGVGFALWRQ